MTTFEYFNKGNKMDKSDGVQESRRRINSQNGKRLLNQSSLKPDRKTNTSQLLIQIEDLEKANALIDQHSKDLMSQVLSKDQ